MGCIVSYRRMSHKITKKELFVGTYHLRDKVRRVRFSESEIPKELFDRKKCFKQVRNVKILFYTQYRIVVEDLMVSVRNRSFSAEGTPP